MTRTLALLAALIVATLIAMADARPPRPAPVHAPAQDFSADRAMADVAVIARAPHPTGAPANAEVRDHLLRRMAALGLSPRVVRDEGLYRRAAAGQVFISGGTVENLIGVLPGRDRSLPALALMTHYDSAPGSPGAGDDAAGVAATLEIVRALKAGGLARRDVIVLITDGEEAGLLGAEAFFARNPLARRIGLIVNMEARGQGGRVQMFQTSPAAGGLVRLLQAKAERPMASSLSTYVYGLMPNDTDLTVSNAAGVPGFNFAFIGRAFDYHAPTATPANLDRGSLQDMGAQVLALSRGAAQVQALPAQAPDLTYSQLFGDLLIAYPAWAGWLILGAAAALLAFGIARARRAETLPLSDIARGAGALLFTALGAAALLRLARRAVGAGYGVDPTRALMAHAALWEATLVVLGLGFLLWSAGELARGRRRIALAPLAAGAACSALGGLDPVGLGLGVAALLIGVASFGRPVGRPGAWAGALLLALALAAGLQAYAPTTAYLVAWPTLAAALTAAATALATRKSLGGTALLALAAALTLGWLGGLAHLLFLGLDMPETLAVCTLLAALVLWPLAHPPEGAPAERRLGPAVLLAGVGLALFVRFDAPWSARHPQANRIVHHFDQTAGRAWRVSLLEATPWVRQALAAEGGAVAERRHWLTAAPHRAAPASAIQPGAQATLERSPDGTLRLTVRVPAGTQEIGLRLRPEAPLELVQAGARPLRQPLPPGVWSRLVWRGGDQLALVLRPAGSGRLGVRWTATLDRWPAEAAPLPRRPAHEAPFGFSDIGVVTGERRFAW
ncbi:M20/M25/M40 family metallo-hydrolase [Phenylobacterium sp.]|jgi:hypothetical protein|uniref:M20/M25/M40 family metallo-hydrolase n=1 Tax=Phenylobacterium sp. TaxID=1871053 RepID=UPI003784C9F3